MANLIEQMNALKGLSDEALSGEAQRPSGSAPPFLVLTELGRRKDMRSRYESEQARRKERTTVIEDLLPQGGMAAPAPDMPPMGGIDAASAGPGFAEGGIVDYADIASRYYAKLDDNPERQDRARKLALLAAGAALLSSKSSNTLRNLGAGLDAGVGAWNTELGAMDAEENDLLGDLMGVGKAQKDEELARLDQDYRERALAQNMDIAMMNAGAGQTADNRTAAIKEFEYVQGLPPELREAYWKMNPPTNPNALTNDLRIAEKTDRIYQDALKQFPVEGMGATLAEDPNAYAGDQLRKAQAAAYQRIAGAYGKIIADEWAAGMGLTTGDLVVGGSGAPVVDQKDPLGLGL